MDRRTGLMWILGWLAACSSTAVDAPTGAARSKNSTTLSLSAIDQRELADLTQALEGNRTLTAEDLRARHRVTHADTLSYEPRAAAGLSLIQTSTLALDEPELQRLSQLGFVVSARQQFPAMLYAYASLYVQDLPLFVSADSILDAVYRSYEAMLTDIEQLLLVSDLSALIDSMRAALPGSPADARVKRDLDLYLAVTRGLLDDAIARPVASADAEEIASLTTQARRATGHERIQLFGAERDLDFSQFTPRGHYARSPELEQYFRALIWLGRTDLRIIETQPDGSQIFQRSQLEAAMWMRTLLDAESLARYRRIDATLEAFVGRSDSMRLTDIDALLSDLQLEAPSALDGLDSDFIARIILDERYGAQRIASQLLVNPKHAGSPLPLDRAFALFGQRYTVDAHVLSNVVHDAVPNRLMPDPLDAAYAAFGNDAALTALGPELDQYAPMLESARLLVDAHAPAYWSESLYTSWLKALRALSPGDTSELPAVSRSAAWDARLLSTQLASWAQLRHANGLYAKASYTAGVMCEFPTAYVEPYPAFFAALTQFAARGLELTQQLSARSQPLGDKLGAYFLNLKRAASMLEEMATLERTGQAFSAAHMAFINQAVHHEPACPGPQRFDGWYAQLDYASLADGRASAEIDPVVADIHTQPTDAGGRDVGRILHIGTGLPRLMVVTVDTCQGPRAYAGVVFAFHERTTDHWKRLNDVDWSAYVQGLNETAPTEARWSSAFVVSE